MSIAIMSWNILCESDYRGVDFSWEKRGGYITAHIEKSMCVSCPQVFCFQEVSLNPDHTQLSDLEKVFSDKYDIFVRRYLRDWGLVAFADKRLGFKSQEHWSDRFLILENKEYCLVNTHFPVPLNDRICVSEWLRNIYDTTEKKFIACGDMNMFPDSGGPEIRKYLSATGLREIDLLAHDGTVATTSFSGYPGDAFHEKSSDRPIDCIFVSAEVEVKDAMTHPVRQLCVGGQYYGASDHFALTAHLGERV